MFRYLRSKIIKINDIDAIIFDFDGVLTNNQVHILQSGEELVSCSRADGLAFEILRKLFKPAYILSTEKNPVVSVRASKLKVPVIQGVDNKVDAIITLAQKEGFCIEKTLYVGNDINDYRVMQQCGYTACPSDSHKKIKEVSNIVLKTDGGRGVVRELLEEVFLLDFIKILYPE